MAPLGLFDLMRCPNGRPPWILVVADYYLLGDESGTHNAAIATLVAGYLATKADWLASNGIWNRAHREARLEKVFHMTDFVCRDHEDYAHLTPPEKRMLIQALVDGILHRPKVGFIAALSRQGYDAVMLHETKKRIRDPYYFALQLFIKIVLSRAPELLQPGDRIVVIFDRRNDEDRAKAAYREMRQGGHDPHGFLYPDCFFMKKQDMPHLIAADILANGAGRFLGKTGLRMKRAEEPQFYRLLAARQRSVPHHWKYYDRVMLETEQARWIKEGTIKLRPPRATS